MTAEIAVLNKSAVALAADSAVTISRGQKIEKTYNVNKLFRLSKFHPVGAMVFDSAELMGVPWETIIKEYRKSLSKTSFATVEDYAADFISYIQRERRLFPPELQRRAFSDAAAVAFYTIRNEAASRVEALTRDGKRVTKTKIKELYEAEIESFFDQLMQASPLDNAKPSLMRALARKEATTISDHVKSVFTGTQLSRSSSGKLRTIAIEMFARGRVPMGKTGVVIAGFGNDEFFPAVHTFYAHAVVMNKLLYRHHPGQSMDHRTATATTSNLFPYGAVIPFAQTDVVSTFVSGVGPSFLEVVYDQIEQLLANYPTLVAEKVGIADNKGKEALKNALLKHNQEAFKNIKGEFQKRIREKHQSPLMDIVSALPKDELANFASALVEVTSIKRKMSRGVETVGGPVDVAIISKGDGFVWISRKHYFKADLNMHYSSNYFSGGERDNPQKHEA